VACGAGADGLAERLEDTEALADELVLGDGADALDEADAFGAEAVLGAGSGLDALDGADDELD